MFRKVGNLDQDRWCDPNRLLYKANVRFASLADSAFGRALQGNSAALPVVEN
jgi:hypothetical protein